MNQDQEVPAAVSELSRLGCLFGSPFTSTCYQQYHQDHYKTTPPPGVFPTDWREPWHQEVQVNSSCVSVKKCPAALKYIRDFQNHAIHNSSIQILQDANCGISGRERKVLCEKIPPCYEPSDKHFCVKVKDCCVALRLIKMNVTFDPYVREMFKQARCSSDSKEVKIKCSSLLEVEDTVLKKMLRSIDTDFCITPSGFKGVCIPWQTCSTFGGKSVDQNMLDFVRRSICDREHQKVCCAVEENVDNVCGLDNSAVDKVAGGEATAKNEFPWAVVLKYTNPEIRCGGTLINSQFVVTAAHCLRTDLEKVIIGGNYHTQREKKLLEFNITGYSIHPFYKRRPVRNDIALLKIPQVSYQDSIKWICLPSPTINLPRNFTIVGNGQDANGTFTKLQMKATLPYTESSLCKKLYKNFLDSVEEFIICAGGEKGIDSCPGDSGGPLMSKENSSVWQLYGVVSGGMSGCALGSPGFYTRVDKYLNWMEQKMKDMM